MSGTTLEFFEEADPTDALVIVAFHTTGAAGPIAAHFLQESLGMPLVGHMVSPTLRGIVQVKSGHATSPVRIHGGDVACQIGRPCQRLFVINAEVPLPPESFEESAETIMQWAKGAGLVLALDAVARDPEDETPDVYVAGADQDALQAMAPSEAEVLEGGLLVGFGAHLLTAGRRHGIRTAALLVEASRSHPDGRAAAALVRSLDKMIPQMVVDPGPLEEQAADLEAQLSKALSEIQEAQKPKRAPHTFI